jgi:2,3-bisphosphoglycerate-independent phosphoglycerate mutase
MMSQNKALLIILDGWGHSPDPNVSAIEQASTPFIDSLYDQFPHTFIHTDGEHVGLPKGQMGNSEVGHMTIGAGRVIDQDLVKISKSIQNQTLQDKPALKEAIQYSKENNKNIHILGLLSDGGIHSHISHLQGLLDVLKGKKTPSVYIHAFTDGRDTDPKSSLKFIKQIQSHIHNSNAHLASIIGRYYAMDRDQRWPRIKQAYDLLTQAKGEQTYDPIQTLQARQVQGQTDEFLEPISVLDPETKTQPTIQEGDVVIFFNYRTDRGRQLTEALTQEPKPDMSPLDLHYLTMTTYDPDFKNVHPIFTKENIQNTLGEKISKAGLKQVRIAETEKAPHVTFFFNGGREEPFPGETRKICQSPKVATYDLQPEMSAECVTQKTIQTIQEESPEFILVNYANADMVGHTGSMEAAIQACQTIDQDLKKVVAEAKAKGYSIIITADHGNCEKMKNQDGSVNTAHTTNLVPLIYISDIEQDLKKVKDLSMISNLITSIIL